MREKWQYIGEELGVDLRRISTKHSDPGEHLREVLSKWFKSCATTWKQIVAVLRTPRIGESHLADNLEVKYCSCELAYSSVNAMWSIIKLEVKYCSVSYSANSRWSLKTIYKYANFCH